MKGLFSTLNQINDTLMNIMFFAWLVVVPCYLFLSSQHDVNQRILQIGFVSILYISFSAFKLFTSNLKIENLLKLIFLFSYALILIKNVNLFELTSIYCALLGIAYIQALLQSITSVIRIFLKDDPNLTAVNLKIPEN